MTTRAAVVLGTVFLVAAGPVPVWPSGQASLHVRHAFVMGTRAELRVYADGRASGLARLEQMLAVIERTEAELSTWRPDSEVSRLNAAAGGGPQPLTPATCRLLAQLAALVEETGGTFDPAVGPLVEAWDLHGVGRVPVDGDLASARARSGWHRVTLDTAACELTLPAGSSLDVGGFGKGEALDRIRAELPAGGSWLADLGGQLAAGGASHHDTWPADLAHPHARTEPALSLRLLTGSLATSAGSERDLGVGGVRVGHILDPRTGRPAAFRGSVTVWAEHAVVADVLSTALYVMGPGEGLRWADARGVAAVFLDAGPGGALEVRRSRAFARRFAEVPRDE